MADENPIIDKIRKLQALKDRAATEAEAANAAARIAELLAKHNLEMGAINLEKEEGKDAGSGPASQRMPPHYSVLAFVCDRLFDVRHYLRWVGAGYQYQFIGLPANVDAACATFSYLVSSVESLLDGWKRSAGPGWSRSDYRAFRIGAAKRIKEIAHKQKEAILLHNPGSRELVLVGNALAKRMHDDMGFEGNRRGGSISINAGSMLAFRKGYEQGSRVNIHGARNSRMLS